MKITRKSRGLLRFQNKLVKTSFILLGVLLAAFGLKGFLVPNHFIDGGITGISLLTYQLTGIPVSVWLILFNIPFIFLGIKQINKEFSVASALAILLLSLVILDRKSVV